MKRKHRSVLIILSVAVFCGLGLYVAREAVVGVIERTFQYDTYADWELAKLRQGLSKGTLSEVEARASLSEVARQNPSTQAQLGALDFLAKKWPSSAEASMALATLPNAIEEMPVDELANCLERTSFDNGHLWKPIGMALIARVEQEPTHPRSGRLLATAALVLKPSDEDLEPSDELLQVAEMIKERYATSPDLANFCEAVSDLGNPRGWMQQFEPHMRHILDVNQDRFVLCSAHFALATIVRSGGIDRQVEAKNVYEEFLAEFDGEVKYHAQSVEQHFRQSATRELRVIAEHGLGKKAPKTEGFDLDGKAISLSDYRGRVVLLSFWATWCGPCLHAIPHERELVERFDSSDFAILGMNADDDIDGAKGAVKKHEMTWRSLHLNDRRCVNNWTVAGYPTFYLLDREGIIVQSWLGLPPESELETTIGNAISANDRH